MRQCDPLLKVSRKVRFRLAVHRWLRVRNRAARRPAQLSSAHWAWRRYGTFKNRDRFSCNHMSQYAMELYSQVGYVGCIACSRPGAIWTNHSPALGTESLHKVPSC